MQAHFSPGYQEESIQPRVIDTNDVAIGVKIQIYGMDSYGYLQYDEWNTGTKNTPPNLLDFVSNEEWQDLTTKLNEILKHHRRQDIIVGFWVVLGILCCTGLMALHDFLVGTFMAVLFAVLVFLLSMSSKSIANDLKCLCQSWSEERQMKSVEHGWGMVQVSFHQEEGPLTRHGQNHLGAIHFLKSKSSHPQS